MTTEKYDELPVCSDEQQEEYFKKAREFLSSTHWYQDSNSTARCAIADYLAWADGVQLQRG